HSSSSRRLFRSEKRSASPRRLPLFRSNSRPSSISEPRKSMSMQSNIPSIKSNRSKEESSISLMKSNRSKEESNISLMKSSTFNRSKEESNISGKSKRLFKSLLSRRKSSKDDTLYTYLDEY
ncbi:hypothetical protein M569_07110, partial [Genlisea aurea]